MASLLIGSGLGWPERDFGVVGELCHVGAHFEALDFHEALSFTLHFLRSLDFPLEPCE